MKTPAYQLRPWVRCYDPMRGCAHLRGAERCVAKHWCSLELQVAMKAKRRAKK